ncbi:TPA: hypothetical protein TXJ06_000411 [Streptococcus suis]|nr:hypothetical protein [Streptococcus suis]HEL1583717.1 hypothetical protein [Streptococcus suis]
MTREEVLKYIKLLEAGRELYKEAYKLLDERDDLMQEVLDRCDGIVDLICLIEGQGLV